MVRLHNPAPPVDGGTEPGLKREVTALGADSMEALDFDLTEKADGEVAGEVGSCNNEEPMTPWQEGQSEVVRIEPESESPHEDNILINKIAETLNSTLTVPSKTDEQPETIAPQNGLPQKPTQSGLRRPKTIYSDLSKMRRDESAAGKKTAESRLERSAEPAAGVQMANTEAHTNEALNGSTEGLRVNIENQNNSDSVADWADDAPSEETTLPEHAGSPPISVQKVPSPDVQESEPLQRKPKKVTRARKKAAASDSKPWKGTAKSKRKEGAKVGKQAVAPEDKAPDARSLPIRPLGTQRQTRSQSRQNNVNAHNDEQDVVGNDQRDATGDDQQDAMDDDQQDAVAGTRDDASSLTPKTTSEVLEDDGNDGMEAAQKDIGPQYEEDDQSWDEEASPREASDRLKAMHDIVCQETITKMSNLMSRVGKNSRHELIETRETETSHGIILSRITDEISSVIERMRTFDQGSTEMEAQQARLSIFLEKLKKKATEIKFDKKNSSSGDSRNHADDIREVLKDLYLVVIPQIINAFTEAIDFHAESRDPPTSLSMKQLIMFLEVTHQLATSARKCPNKLWREKVSYSLNQPTIHVVKYLKQSIQTLEAKVRGQESAIQREEQRKRAPQRAKRAREAAEEIDRETKRRDAIQSLRASFMLRFRRAELGLSTEELSLDRPGGAAPPPGGRGLSSYSQSIEHAQAEALRFAAEARRAEERTRGAACLLHTADELQRMEDKARRLAQLREAEWAAVRELWAAEDEEPAPHRWDSAARDGAPRGVGDTGRAQMDLGVFGWRNERPTTAEKKKLSTEEMRLAIELLERHREPDRYMTISTALACDMDEVFAFCRDFKTTIINDDKARREKNPGRYFPPVADWITSIE